VAWHDACRDVREEIGKRRHVGDVAASVCSTQEPGAPDAGILRGSAYSAK
jgi:hypothetical protein